MVLNPPYRLICSEFLALAPTGTLKCERLEPPVIVRQCIGSSYESFSAAYTWWRLFSVADNIHKMNVKDAKKKEKMQCLANTTWGIANCPYINCKRSTAQNFDYTNELHLFWWFKRNLSRSSTKSPSSGIFMENVLVMYSNSYKYTHL